MHGAIRKGDFCPQEDAMTNRIITLNESECIDVTAALESSITANVFDGPANPFEARRKNCKALLKKLRAASLSPPAH
jgi:hypothetical protein